MHSRRQKRTLATVYRNYFAEVNGKIGQSADNQIDCLTELGIGLGNQENQLWEMQNGYAMASADGLRKISQRLSTIDESERNRLRQLLRVGIQWNTQVTLRDANHTVSQVYCSALPVAYSRHSSDLWADFAQLVLEASYEAAICVTALNVGETGDNRVFLTLLGGGAFGNRDAWIFSAMQRAIQLFSKIDLEVAIVSYGRSNPSVRKFITGWSD